MKTTLPWKVLPKKNKFMNIIASQLVTLLLIIGIVSTNLAQTPALLDPTTVPKFENPLPVIKDLGLRYDLTQGNTEKKNGKIKRLDVKMEETFQNLGLGINPATGAPYMTRVWGYKFPKKPITYPGATIVAMKGEAIDIRWKNNLPSHFLPVDASLHMAHPPGVDVATWYAAGNVPTVTHLHGGRTESASDGLPEAWFTQDFAETGAYFVKQEYHYDNDQEAATLWYHDHALGITRLNVYAGLAGFYLLRDNHEMGLINNGTLPSGDYEIEIVIQDRNFTADGQLFLPAKNGDPFFDGNVTVPAGVGENTIVAEFFGDFILVNGKAWPKLDVEQTKYRFRTLNGSDSRVYNLKIMNGGSPVSFMQIGTDNGLLPSPVTLTELLLAPGERADLVVDFSTSTGQLTIVNTGPDEPFKGGNFVTDVTRPTGQIMQFNVQAGGNPPTFDITGSTTLRGEIEDLVQTGATRKLALFEGEDADGRLQPLLGVINGDNAKTTSTLNGSLAWFEAITENPGLNDVEVWEVYNATEDAHPIHLHLVSFQILDRTPFSASVNTQPQPEHDGGVGIGGYIEENSITFTGPPEDPAANEMGWKDTFVVPPGYMGRVIAKFDRIGRYVWHCHILSHEDHEMMRPYEVIPSNARLASNDGRIIENFPNPFETSTQVRFELKRAQDINFTVFDMTGKMVYNNLDFYPEGKHAIFWDGFDRDGKILQTGVYLYRLQGEDFNESKRLVIER